MPVNGNQKGKVGERELAALFREFGFTARRGQQFAGGGDSPDVVHDIPGVHVECKRVERFDMWAAIEQAKRDKKPEDEYAVFHRPNKREWIVVLDAGVFLAMMKDLCPVTPDAN